MNTITFAYFGSSEFSIDVLETLQQKGFIPRVIVTTPDKPRGRHLTITPNIVKVWGEKNGIKVLSPEKLDQNFIDSIVAEKCDVFIVASYGKIIPQAVLDIPAHHVLNIHPSLLPQYRGATPLQTAMIEDTKNTGVTIMRLDAQMDHGPIIVQKEITISQWPIYEEFEKTMATLGGELLAEILPNWISGKTEKNSSEKEQNHTKATYTKKIEKEDAHIDLSNDAYSNFRKIQAYHRSPQAYTFIEKNGKQVRVKITSASFADNKLIIEKVIPEGKSEMKWNDFLQ